MLFDQDKSGTIEPQELMDGLHMLTKGSPVQKLKFLFDVFDSDGETLTSPGSMAELDARPLAKPMVARSSSARGPPHNARHPMRNPLTNKLPPTPTLEWPIQASFGRAKTPWPTQYQNYPFMSRKTKFKCILYSHVLL